MGTANLAVFLIGGAATGAGAGVLFKSAVGSVAATAAPALRGEALAGLFLISYLGMSIPAVRSSHSRWALEIQRSAIALRPLRTMARTRQAGRRPYPPRRVRLVGQ